jgi:amino acid transporter
VLAVLIYMVYAVQDSDWGFDGLVSLATIGLLSAMFFSALSVGACFLIGLPLRYGSLVLPWWKKHYWLSPMIAIVGVGVVLYSLMPGNLHWVEVPGDPDGGERLIPQLTFVLTGWFVSIFGVLHTFLPTRPGSSVQYGATTQPDN